MSLQLYGWVSVKLKKRVLNLWLITSQCKAKIKLLKTNWNKGEEICRDCSLDMVCDTNGITPDFYLELSAAYSKSCQISKMDRFAKIANGWIMLTVFTISSKLNLWCLTSCWIRPWFSRMFLWLLIETATLNLPRMFLKWLISYVNISSRNQKGVN